MASYVDLKLLENRYSRVENCENCYVKNPTSIWRNQILLTLLIDLKVPMRTIVVIRLSTQTFEHAKKEHNTYYNMLRQCFSSYTSGCTSLNQTRHSFLKYIWTHSNVRSNGIRDPYIAYESQIMKSLRIKWSKGLNRHGFY
jgi:hypothetical protein